MRRLGRFIEHAAVPKVPAALDWRMTLNAMAARHVVPDKVSVRDASAHLDPEQNFSVLRRCFNRLPLGHRPIPIAAQYGQATLSLASAIRISLHIDQADCRRE